MPADFGRKPFAPYAIRPEPCQSARGGKLFRERPKTNGERPVFSVTKLRLADCIKEKQSELDVESRGDAGKMTFGEALEVCHQPLDSDPDSKEGQRSAGGNAIPALLKSWPDLETANTYKR